MEKQALNAVKSHLLKAVRGLMANPANGDLAGRVARLSDAARASKLYGMELPGIRRLADGTMVSARTGHALPHDPLARQLVLDAENGSRRWMSSAIDRAMLNTSLDMQRAALEGTLSQPRPGLLSRGLQAFDDNLVLPFHRATTNVMQRLTPGKSVARRSLNDGARKGSRWHLNSRDVVGKGKVRLGGADVELYATRPGHAMPNVGQFENNSVSTWMPGIDRSIIGVDRRRGFFDPVAWMHNNPQASLEHEIGHAVSHIGDPETRNRLARMLSVEIRRQHRLTGGQYGKKLVTQGPRGMYAEGLQGYVDRRGEIHSAVGNVEPSLSSTLRNEAQATYIPQVLRGERSAIYRLGKQYQDPGSRLYGYRKASPVFRNVMDHLSKDYNYGEMIPLPKPRMS